MRAGNIPGGQFAVIRCLVKGVVLSTAKGMRRRILPRKTGDMVKQFGVDFCDRSEVDEHFLPVSTRRVSGAWPRQRCPCLRRSARRRDPPPRAIVSASLLAVAAGGLARRRAYYYGIVYTTESRGSVWRDMRVNDRGSFLR